jgi:hypothetical protein
MALSRTVDTCEALMGGSRRLTTQFKTDDDCPCNSFFGSIRLVELVIGFVERPTALKSALRASLLSGNGLLLPDVIQIKSGKSSQQTIQNSPQPTFTLCHTQPAEDRASPL